MSRLQGLPKRSTCLESDAFQFFRRHNVSSRRARSLELSSSSITQVPTFVSGDLHGNRLGVPPSHHIYFCPSVVLVTFFRGGDFLFMQGSRTACITQSHIHISGCPVCHNLHRMYGSPWVATPLMLPSRPSLPKAWPLIPSHFVRASILPHINISIYVSLGAPSLWKSGRSLARCLVLECTRSDFIAMHHPPPPSFWAWNVNLVSGSLGL